jgi:signal transduction histidine kinase
MSVTDPCPLAGALARQLRESREELVRRWIERIIDRVAIDPNRIFPTEDLLDHVPLLIEGIADYMETPADEITADIPVVAKALELGALRYEQGFSAHEIMREYEILGGVLFTFLTQSVDAIEENCSRSELLACTHRLFRAVTVVQQVTTGHYLRLSDQLVHEREARLRGFNRAVSHELKNRIGAASGAVSMIQEEWILGDTRQVLRFAGIASRNLVGMQQILKNLIELSRLDSSAVKERHLLLPDVAREVKRQLREFAEARGVEVEVADDMPFVEVPAAALELALSNYVSNAIKYRAPGQREHWVRIGGELVENGAVHEVVVRVSDNGIGVPPEAREHLFERFFRAHDQTVTGEEGT